MTGKDNTGDQLVASIRKTKSAATAKKKTAVRRKPATTRAAPAKASSAAKPEAGNGFQHGRRVWPD